MQSVQIEGVMEAFVVWTNDGLHVCESPATANRLAKRSGVNGADALVTQTPIYKISGMWYMPGALRQPNAADLKTDEAKERLREVKEKAKKAGLSSEEIELLYTQRGV